MAGAACMLLAAAALAAAPAAPPGGLTLVYEGRGRTTTLRLLGDQARVDEGGESLFFDGAARRLVVLSHADRTWAVLDEAALRDQGRRIQAELRARLEELTPDQRARLEQLGRPARRGAEPFRDLVPTGKMERVAGLPCEVHRHEHPARPAEELCLVAWGPRTVRREELLALDRLSAFLGALLGELGPRAAETLRASRANLGAAPGFPARAVELRGDGRVVEEELVKLRRGPLPPSTFAVPEGYRRVAPPGMTAGDTRPLE